MSTGNFHGEPLAFAGDMLAIARRRAGRRSPSGAPTGCSTRRSPATCRRSSPRTPAPTPGYMIAQYTAASLVSENKVLAHPASVDTIPTSGNQEDHVSMGWTSVRKLREVVANVRAVLAVEIAGRRPGPRLPGRASPRRARPAAPCYARVRAGRPDDGRGPQRRRTRSRPSTACCAELVAAAEAAVGAPRREPASPGSAAGSPPGWSRSPTIPAALDGARLVGGRRRPSRAQVVCARFADVRDAPLPPAPLARRPDRRLVVVDWPATSTSPASAGSAPASRPARYYQVNLCRVLSAPLPAGADLLGLAGLLARGQPRAVRRRGPAARRPASTW